MQAHITGTAKQCIDGIPTSAANYVPAYKLLQERFGNEHLVIQAHMKEITKLKTSSGKATELRKLLDTISSNVRSLETKGVNKAHFGALLIPMIQDKVPSDVDLLISRKMGK